MFEQAGKPPVTLKAGETFFVPAGTVHNATNKGSARARVLATYIVEKGKAARDSGEVKRAVSAVGRRRHSSVAHISLSGV